MASITVSSQHSGNHLAVQAAPNFRTRLRRLLFGTIRNKIIVPFLFLTLIVAMLGTFIVTRLIASKAQDRLTNQLLEASRATSDSLVNWETYHLDTLRLTVFAVGVPEAIRDGNSEQLSLVLTGLAANENAYLLIAISRDGSIIADVRQGASGYEQGKLSGQNLQPLSSVQRVLDQTRDPQGDKFAELVELGGETILLTVAPVKDESNNLLGAVAVGTPVRKILANTKTNVLADLILYQPDGAAALTTLVLAGDTNASALNITPQMYQAAVASQGVTQLKTVSVNRREYQEAIIPMVIRGETVGVVGVAYPATLVSSLITTNQSGMTVLFGLIATLVVVLGYMIAANLATPIRRLAQTAEAVREGDLQQQSGVRTSDEIGILGRVFDDMTVRLGEQTETLQQLYKEQEKEAAYLAAVISSTAEGTVVVAMDGAITRLNPVATVVINHDRERWLPELSLVMNRLLRGETPQHRVEMEGEWFDILAAPIRTTRGNQIGVVMTLHNVTEQVLTDRMRTTFILQMSHELYTPLTAFKGYAELAYSCLDDKQSQAGQFLPLAIENAVLLDQMINQLLDVAQMNRGGFEIQPDSVELSAVINEVAKEYQPLVIDRGLSFETRVKSGMWVTGDARRLKWALSHLLKNAVDYTLPGGKLGIYMNRSNGHALVRVLDTGVGIAPHDRPHIFEQFYRGNPIMPGGALIDVRGTGLGLFIADQVIRAHDGHINVDSKVGKGSQFTIYLPLSEDASNGSSTNEYRDD